MCLAERPSLYAIQDAAETQHFEPEKRQAADYTPRCDLDLLFAAQNQYRYCGLKRFVSKPILMAT